MAGRKERKVVTVLFADLVGFTARAETLDPEDVEAILSPYHAHLRAELERFGGTVEKFIGDAVMAVFGAPAAHEDDAERAVRAALAIRDWAADEGGVEVRIAVNTGEALVSVEARPEVGEAMVAGDVVNTAARMQSAAPVNGVLVGGATYRATAQAVEYRPAAPVEAKGKAEPVPAWEAVEARSRFGVDVRQHGASPLVGRERELAVLVGALERARREESCQLVTLVGVPGIGKSRLVFELFRRVDDDEELIFWRQGRSLPYGEGVSFWALGEMVKAHAGILEGDGAETARAKLERTVRDLLPEDEAGWVEASLRPLVGIGGEGGVQPSETYPAWRRLLEAIAERGPLVLVFEDLHWADDGMLDFVDHLVDWAGPVPLLVVATARPELLERRPGWAGGKLNATTVALPPLADDAAARLIGSLLDRSVLPATQQRALLERAGGNPLYAEQFIRLFRERGSTDDLPLPETVHGIVAARLDGLSPEEKAVLQDAAVHGKIFWSGALGGDPAHLRELLHALERKEFVRRERRSSVEGQDEYAFRHVLVRDVAYGQIPRRPRAEKHRCAAAWIETLGRQDDHAELLAHHYLAALELVRAAGSDASELAEPARRALLAAGERAQELSAFPAARRFFAAALELWPADAPDRGRVLLGLGLAVFNTEEGGEDELREARDLLLESGDAEDAAVAEVTRVELAWKRGDRDTCFARLARAQELVADAPDGHARTLVLSSVARYLMLAGENEEAIRVGSEALAAAERLGLHELQSHALNNIGPAKAASGRMEEGLADLERSIAIAAEHNSTEGLRGHVNLGSVLGVNGDVRRAREVHERGLVLARRFGHQPNVDWLEAEVASDAFLLGDWERSLELGARFIEAGEAGRHHYQETGRLAERAFVRYARGDLDGGLADAERSLELARNIIDPQSLGPALAGATFFRLVAGRAAEADELAQEVLTGRGFPIYATPAYTTWAFLRLGRGPALLGALDPLGRANVWVAASRAFLEDDLAAAADLYDGGGTLSDAAFVRLQLAAELVAAGRRAEADPHLRAALGFWRSVNATRFVREGEALLAAAG